MTNSGMSNREWGALCVLGGLVVVVVIVGLWRGTLDATAVTLALVTSITGIITGLIAKGSFGSGGRKKEGGDAP